MPLTNQGIYSGTCESIGLDESKNGTPLMDVIFNVTHVAANGDWELLSSSLQKHVRIYLSEAAWDTSEVKLQRLDFNGDFNHPAITTDPVVLECNHEEYNGKVGEKWELQYEGRERKAPSADVIRKLSARYKTAQTLNPPPPAAPPAAPPDDGPPPSDDDVPGDVDESDIPF